MTIPDREKVIKELEALQKSMLEHQCYTCSYEFIEIVKEFGTNIITDALALLKEQEAVEPRIQTDFDGKGTWWYICGSCNNAISPKDKYCRECGKMVKWE